MKWFLWALLALGALLGVAVAVQAVTVGNTYWEATVQDCSPATSGNARWTARTGPGFGAAPENNQGIVWSVTGSISLRSYDTNNVYSSQGTTTGMPATSGVSLSGFPCSQATTATSIATTWEPVTNNPCAATCESFRVRQILTVGGTSTSQNYLQLQAQVCNTGSANANVGLRAWWDGQAGIDTQEEKAWAAPGMVLGPYTNIMEIKDNPTEMGLTLRRVGGAFTYFMTLNNDPLLWWLPTPPVVPDRFMFWGFGQSTGTSWEPGGAPGGNPGDGLPIYYWGRLQPIMLAPQGCFTGIMYFTPVVTAVPPPPPQPQAAFDFLVGVTPCRPAVLELTDHSRPTPQGSITSWLWQFGDGTTSTARNPAKVYAAPGTYPVTLTIVDSGGLNSTMGPVMIDIPESPNCCPEVAPVQSRTIREGSRVTFQVRASDPEGDDIWYSITGLPSGMSIDWRGILDWQTRPGDAGDYAGEVQVTDAECYVNVAVRIKVLAHGRAASVPDVDMDGIEDDADNCPHVANPGQEDSDWDGVGDACQETAPRTWPAREPMRPLPMGLKDSDRDGVWDHADNCPLVPNRLQTDGDGDGIGDACDEDRDGDHLHDLMDHCHGCEDHSVTSPVPAHEPSSVVHETHFGWATLAFLVVGAAVLLFARPRKD